MNDYNQETTASEAITARNRYLSEKKSRTTVLAIVIAFSPIIFVVMAYTFASNHYADDESPKMNVSHTEASSSAEPASYYVSENSIDSESEYKKWLKEQKISAKTSEESLLAFLDEVFFQISLKNYDAAKTILDNIDLSAHSSSAELYQYWNTYSRLYAEDALNNETLFIEYSVRANEYIDSVYYVNNMSQ